MAKLHFAQSSPSFLPRVWNPWSLLESGPDVPVCGQPGRLYCNGVHAACASGLPEGDSGLGPGMMLWTRDQRYSPGWGCSAGQEPLVVWRGALLMILREDGRNLQEAGGDNLPERNGEMCRRQEETICPRGTVKCAGGRRQFAGGRWTSAGARGDFAGGRDKLCESGRIAWEEGRYLG